MFGKSLPSLQAAVFAGLDPRIFAAANGGAGLSLPELLPPPGSSPGYAGGQFGGFGRGPLQRWDSIGTPGGADAQRIDPSLLPGGILVDGQPADQAASQPIPPPGEMGGLDEALARNAELGRQQASQPKKKGFKDFLRAWAGLSGDALTGNPSYANYLQHQRRLEEAEREAQLKARLPQQVGNSVIVPDGLGGYRTVFRDPSTPEAYALAQGFKPGTAEYANAVQQYRLGSWSETAMAARTELEGLRYKNRDALQDERLSVTRRGQDIRSADTRRGQGLRGAKPAQAKPPTPTTVIGGIMKKQAAGAPLTAAEQRTYDEYRAGKGKGRSGGGSDLLGPVYQRDGRRVQYSRKAGGYVDLATGQRVQ